jgi:hypothetical protein
VRYGISPTVNGVSHYLTQLDPVQMLARSRGFFSANGP